MKSFDLTVVGSGILGVFHAYHALQKGLTVCLAEKDAEPVAATVRNFGQVVPSGLSADWLKWGKRSLEIYQSIQDEFDISFRTNGSVYIASDDQENQLLVEVKERMDAQTYPCIPLTAGQCLDRWPLRESYCKSGLFFPLDASIEPGRLVHCMIQYLQKKFCNHLTYMPITSIVKLSSEFSAVTIETLRGETWKSSKVIICNGSEFRLLYPELFKDSGLIHVKLQMMQTRSFSNVKLMGNILTGLTIRRYESFKECPSYSSMSTPEQLQELKTAGIHILFKQALNGSIIIGDSHEYANANELERLGFGLSQNIQELILREASRIVNFNVYDLQSCWAGYYTQHPDRDIFVHDVDDRIRICTGIGGKGMTSAAGFSENQIQNLFA